MILAKAFLFAPYSKFFLSFKLYNDQLSMTGTEIQGSDLIKIYIGENIGL